MNAKQEGEREADPFHISYFKSMCDGVGLLSHSRILTQPLSLSLTAGGVTLFTPKQGNPTSNQSYGEQQHSTASKKHATHTPPPCISTTVTTSIVIGPKAYMRRPVSYLQQIKSNQIDYWKEKGLLRHRDDTYPVERYLRLGQGNLRNNLRPSSPDQTRSTAPLYGVDTEIMTHFKGIGQQPARQPDIDCCPARAEPRIIATRPRKQQDTPVATRQVITRNPTKSQVKHQVSGHVRPPYLLLPIHGSRR